MELLLRFLSNYIIIKVSLTDDKAYQIDDLCEQTLKNTTLHVHLQIPAIK